MGDTAGVAVWAKSTYRLNSFFRKISQKKEHFETYTETSKRQEGSS